MSTLLPVRPRSTPREWALPVALVVLSTIPLTAGVMRLAQLSGSGPMPADDRISAFPLPFVLHIVGATTYALLGIAQLVPRLRRRHLGWHRRAGRVATLAGLLVAGSGLWMTLGYAPKPGTGDLLFLLRLVFGSAMAACLVLGIAAVRRGDIASHRAWMVRGYAIGIAAGTQAFTEGIVVGACGTGEVRTDLAKGAGWVLNLAVAEWALRRPAAAAVRP